MGAKNSKQQMGGSSDVSRVEGVREDLIGRNCDGSFDDRCPAVIAFNSDEYVRVIEKERFAARALLRQIGEALQEKQPHVSALELCIINQIQRVLVEGK